MPEYQGGLGVTLKDRSGLLFTFQDPLTASEASWNQANSPYWCGLFSGGFCGVVIGDLVHPMREYG